MSNAVEDHAHPYGHSVNIMNYDENKKVVIDKTKLDEMFLHDEVKNRRPVVISIIGAFRKGKSFFLDYCLRFMYANVSLKTKTFGELSIFEISVLFSTTQSILPKPT